MLKRLKARFPRNASRAAGVRMVAIGAPVTVLVVVALTRLVRWGITALIGGM